MSRSKEDVGGVGIQDREEVMYLMLRLNRIVSAAYVEANQCKCFDEVLINLNQTLSPRQLL